MARKKIAVTVCDGCGQINHDPDITSWTRIKVLESNWDDFQGVLDLCDSCTVHIRNFLEADQ